MPDIDIIPCNGTAGVDHSGDAPPPQAGKGAGGPDGGFAASAGPGAAGATGGAGVAGGGGGPGCHGGTVSITTNILGPGLRINVSGGIGGKGGGGGPGGQGGDGGNGGNGVWFSGGGNG